MRTVLTDKKFTSGNIYTDLTDKKFTSGMRTVSADKKFTSGNGCDKKNCAKIDKK